jgi:hypothetical protein
LDVLGTWPVIITAGIFFLLEALADKIPFVDNLWDLVHTVVRPLGACFVGFAILGKANPMIMVIAALFAGTIALASHSGKAGARISMNVMSPAENISNIVVSSAEDVGAGLLTFIALKYPFQAASIAIIILILMATIIPSLLRWSWYVLNGIFVWIKSLGQKLLNKTVQPDNLPSEHTALLHPQKAELASLCKAQNVKNANGRSGYLSLAGNDLVFTYNTWFGAKVWRINTSQIIASSLTQGWLMDVLEIHYVDHKNKKHKSVFAFLKDRTPLAEKFSLRLKPASE